jgi:dihydrofolate synthase/folylpolyglutamate synthase
MNAIEYLFGLEFHGHKLGLENIRTLADALGRPQDAYRSVHVAGTNGKGSVCAMLDAALRAAGHRVGLYTSPHLVHLEERFVVDGVPAARDEVEDVIDHIRALAEELQAHSRLRSVPTYFEVATATAFELFRRAGVNVAVLEVGLGGRLDATNVASPAVGVITNIDLEHEQYLGSTLAAIAGEKAGIVKPGMTVVTAERKPEARDVIARTCRDQRATLVDALAGAQVVATTIEGRIRASIDTPGRSYPAAVLGLRGRHQLDNAIVALRALEALDAAGIRVPPDAAVAGLEQARWPGRLDLIELGDGRRLLLDAAHNPAGARTLAAYLAETFPEGLPMVIGAVRDKDHRGMLTALLPHATRVVVTEPPTPRAAPVDHLATAVRDTLEELRHPAQVFKVPDRGRALERAFGGGSTVCVTGSIFLIGAVIGEGPLGR